MLSAASLLAKLRGASPAVYGRYKYPVAVASANDLDLSGKTGGLFLISGTTTINGIKMPTAIAGTTVAFYFSGILTLTHNGSPSAGYSKLYLSALANVTTSATGACEFIYDGSVWRERGIPSIALTGGTAGTVTASKAVVVDSNKDIASFRNLTLQNLDAGASGTAGTVDIFPTTASKGKIQIAAADQAGDTTLTITNRSQAQASTLTIPDLGATADVQLLRGGTMSVVGAAKSIDFLVGKKTGIADNTATDIITVTVPNVNASAAIKIDLVAALGTGTDTFESTRYAEGCVVIARQAGANVVAATATLALAQIATVSGGGTITLAYDLGAVSGAVGATNTFTIRVTIVKTGTITDLQCMFVARLINAETGGVTMAAA